MSLLSAPLPWRTTAAAVLVLALLAGACSDSAATPPTPTPPPAITPPAELAVPRAQPSCYVRQEPAATIPAVKGYRLALTRDLPEGIVPTVKAVRFVGGGDTRVLEAEVCFMANDMAPAGRYDAQLELRLYSVDSEKLAGSTKLSPVRVLPFNQVITVK